MKRPRVVTDRFLPLLYEPFPSLDSLSEIFLILYGGIGDLVCLTGALAGLRKNYPGIDLYLLTSPFARDFFPTELVTKVFFEDEEFCTAVLSRKNNSKTVVVNLHSTLRSSEVSGRLLERGVSVFGLCQIGGSLFVRGGAFHDLLHRTFYLKHGDSYVQSWVLWGRSAMLSMNLGTTALLNPRIVVRSRPETPGNYVVLVPDANAPTRKWCLEYWVALADYLARKGLTPVILGRERIEAFSSEAWNLTGKTTLEEAIGYLPGCELVVSNDTGMIHLAGALGKKVLVLCGPNNVGPEAEGEFVSIRFPVTCSPCFNSVCERMECMKRLSPVLVISALEAMLSGRKDFPKELVVGYSWSQPLSIFYDLHSLDLPYRGEFAYRNFVRWAWLFALAKQEGVDLRGWRDFFQYWRRFHEEDETFAALVEEARRYLISTRDFVLPLSQKIDILVKKGARLTPQVESSLTTILSNVNKELTYPWPYVTCETVADYYEIIRSTIQRIDWMLRFLERYGEE